MTMSSRSATAQKCVTRLEGELEDAKARARSYDFDEPDERSIRVARDLIAALAQMEDAIHGLEIGVGVDGCIEITGRVRATHLTVEVSPTGSRIDAVLDTEAGIVWVGEQTSAEDLLKELERAA